MTRGSMVAAAVSAVVAAVTACSGGGHSATTPPRAIDSATPTRSPTVTPTALARTPKLAPGYVTADFQGQPARPCADAGRAETVTFKIEPGTPQPSCWKLDHFVAVRIVNG